MRIIALSLMLFLTTTLSFAKENTMSDTKTKVKTKREIDKYFLSIIFIKIKLIIYIEIITEKRQEK